MRKNQKHRRTARKEAAEKRAENYSGLTAQEKIDKAGAKQLSKIMENGQ